MRPTQTASVSWIPVRYMMTEVPQDTLSRGLCPSTILEIIPVDEERQTRMASGVIGRGDVANPANKSGAHRHGAGRTPATICAWHRDAQWLRRQWEGRQRPSRFRRQRGKRAKGHRDMTDR